MRNSIVWIPVLLVGSMLYWTLALGFGGLSLMSVTSQPIPCTDETVEETVRNSYQSITVNLGDSLAPAGQPSAAVTVDLVADAEQGRVDDSAGQDGENEQGVPDADRRGSGRRSRSDQGPGETAF